MPMPRELRFCRNCGFRLGEGVAEYTETVRFDKSAKSMFGTAPTAEQQSLKTNYGFDGTIADAASRKLGKRGFSGMTWLFICLIVFFVAAGSFTALIKPLRTAANLASSSQPASSRSYVGVPGFSTTDGGVTFADVEPPGSPADKAGLVGGDVITSYDGHAVSDEDQLRTLVVQTPIGKTVDVVYIRDGETKTTKLTTISKGELDRLTSVFRNRPEGRGLFGYESGDTERVEIAGTKMFGVRLDNVSPSLPADMAGVKVGDVVIEFDGIPIRTSDELLSRVRRAIPYSTIKLVVMRGTERIEIPIKMGRDT
jgi:S1-C subfamily serine protease